MRYNIARGGYTTMQTPCLEGPDDNMGQKWTKVVAQVQRDDPDISVVLSHLLKEWRKPAVEELQSMSYAARVVWAQFELLLSQQGVLYMKSAGHTTQAKLRMVLPKQWRRPLSKFMMALLVPT